MAANLTPQYLKAEENYRRAQSLEEELQWLEAMFREIPKHKASEKMQSELKTKISRVKKELESERKSGGPKTGPAVKIPRQGAGTCVMIGGPNAGKSQLLARLTRAAPEVAPYPFTTRVPLPGMMSWEDVMIQLIDTPPITQDYFEPYMQGLVRGADVVLLVVDLGADEGIEQLQELLDRFEQTKTRLGRESKLDEEDIGRSYTQTIVVGNKLDDPDAAARLELLHELCPLDLPELLVSAESGAGLDALREAVFRALDVVRVYTKNPKAKEPDMDRPFTVRRGGTVLDVAELVHKDVAAGLKFARLWGVGVHDGESVKGDHVVHDRDIVELHT